MRMRFNSHSLVSIICHYILENLLFWEELSFFVITYQPEPWSLVVEIIGDTEVIRSNLVHCFIGLIAHYIFSCCEYIITSIFSFFLQIVNIYGLLLLCILILNVLHIIDIINIHSFTLAFAITCASIGIWVVSCEPSIFNFLLFALLLTLQILNSLWTWNVPGNLYPKTG